MSVKGYIKHINYAIDDGIELWLVAGKGNYSSLTFLNCYDRVAPHAANWLLVKSSELPVTHEYWLWFDSR